MLTFDDCLNFCELTEDEVLAISEHEHMPEIVAVELGCCLLKTEAGVGIIKSYMLDDIHHAESHGLTEKALHWRVVYQNFLTTHPN